MSLHPPTKPRSRTISPRPPPLDIPRSPPVESPLASGSGFRVPREQSTSNTPSTSNTNTDSMPSSTYTDTDTETDIDSAHPFANSTAKLEVLKNGGEIDVEEESRLYDEIYGTWDGDDDVVSPPSPTFLPQGTSSASIFSKDIYLADNTGNSSGAFARDVRITGWSQVGELDSRKSPRLGSMSSGLIGTVYDIKITTKSNTTIHLLKRYTDFSRLHTTLLRTLPPSLHPHVRLCRRKHLCEVSPVFLDRRRRMLQFWLACVLLHPEVGGCECVRGWVVG
ncbi:hypothetical protein BDQ17DRAFT_1355012 [Cyathus striatus]|nr:hypothetical protein BDQ17DRAFT_1355012 [Cyathus striatus]